MTSPAASPLSSTTTFVLGQMALALLVSTGCNFILNPANSDDIIRCKNTTECEKEAFFITELRKERTDAACGAPGGGGGDFTSSKTNQVCSLVDKAGVSCTTVMLPAGKYADIVEEASMNAAAYVACPTDKLGTLGCGPTNNNTCAGGLKLNDFKTCDDGKGPNPLIAASDALILQDVQDQQCRSYFCDDSFVCNRETEKCTRCDESLGFEGLGVGACGDLALGGARSTVYLPQETLVSECPETSNFDATQFGKVVVAAP